MVEVAALCDSMTRMEVMLQKINEIFDRFSGVPDAATHPTATSSSTPTEFVNTSAGTQAAGTAAFFPAEAATDDAAQLSLPLLLADADGVPASGAGAAESAGPTAVALLPTATTSSTAMTSATSSTRATSAFSSLNPALVTRTAAAAPVTTTTASLIQDGSSATATHGARHSTSPKINASSASALTSTPPQHTSSAFTIVDANTPAGHSNGAQKVFDEMSPQQKVLSVLDVVGRKHITETATRASFLVVRNTAVEDDYRLQDFLGVRGHRICKASTKRLKYLKRKPALICEVLDCCLSPHDSNPVRIDDGRARCSTYNNHA